MPWHAHMNAHNGNNTNNMISKHDNEFFIEQFPTRRLFNFKKPKLQVRPGTTKDSQSIAVKWHKIQSRERWMSAVRRWRSGYICYSAMYTCPHLSVRANAFSCNSILQCFVTVIYTFIHSSFVSFIFMCYKNSKNTKALLLLNPCRRHL